MPVRRHAQVHFNGPSSGATPVATATVRPPLLPPPVHVTQTQAVSELPIAAEVSLPPNVQTLVPRPPVCPPSAVALEDARHSYLVNRVQAWQRSSPTQCEMWYFYVRNHNGEHKDPRRYDSEFLEVFLASAEALFGAQGRPRVGVSCSSDGSAVNFGRRSAIVGVHNAVGVVSPGPPAISSSQKVVACVQSVGTGTEPVPEGDGCGGVGRIGEKPTTLADAADVTPNITTLVTSSEDEHLRAAEERRRVRAVRRSEAEVRRAQRALDRLPPEIELQSAEELRLLADNLRAQVASSRRQYIDGNPAPSVEAIELVAAIVQRLVTVECALLRRGLIDAEARRCSPPVLQPTAKSLPC